MVNIILGGAGFIGTNLSAKLSELGEKVIVCDNLSNSKLNFIPFDANVSFLEVDCCNFDLLFKTLQANCDMSKKIKLWHLAANSDIKKGLEDLKIDYYDTLGTTISSLKLVEKFRISHYIFASTSAIYGNANYPLYRETDEVFIPASAYGVMKLASEQLIRIKLSSILNLKTRIYRFPNVIGLPLTHGVIRDLFIKLVNKPDFLNVLGDGNQFKPFMHIDDLVDSIIYLNNLDSGFEIFNLGPSGENVKIRYIASLLRDTFSPNTEIVYESKNTGWDGDVPEYKYDISKARSFGLPIYSDSKSSIDRIIEQLKQLDPDMVT